VLGAALVASARTACYLLPSLHTCCHLSAVVARAALLPLSRTAAFSPHARLPAPPRCSVAPSLPRTCCLRMDAHCTHTSPSLHARCARVHLRAAQRSPPPHSCSLRFLARGQARLVTIWDREGRKIWDAKIRWNRFGATAHSTRVVRTVCVLGTASTRTTSYLLFASFCASLFAWRTHNASFRVIAFIVFFFCAASLRCAVAARSQSRILFNAVLHCRSHADVVFDLAVSLLSRALRRTVTSYASATCSPRLRLVHRTYAGFIFGRDGVYRRHPLLLQPQSIFLTPSATPPHRHLAPPVRRIYSLSAFCWTGLVNGTSMGKGGGHVTDGAVVRWCMVLALGSVYLLYLLPFPHRLPVNTHPPLLFLHFLCCPSVTFMPGVVGILHEGKAGYSLHCLPS